MKKKASGLSDIKTTQGAKVRAMPKRQGANYLDLYVLTKEKARLEEEKSVVDKRKEQLESNIKELEREIETLTKTLSQQDGQTVSPERVKKKAPQKEWKTMPLEY